MKAHGVGYRTRLFGQDCFFLKCKTFPFSVNKLFLGVSDLMDKNEVEKIGNPFPCKNASTQTWMPLAYGMKKVPQSSQRESNARLPSSIRPYVVDVDLDSVFDSEVSSKPHFPSSASNYAESTKEGLGFLTYSLFNTHQPFFNSSYLCIIYHVSLIINSYISTIDYSLLFIVCIFYLLYTPLIIHHLLLDIPHSCSI